MISILIALLVFWAAATAGVLAAAHLATRGGRQAPEGAVVGYLMAGTLAGILEVIAWTLVR